MTSEEEFPGSETKRDVGRRVGVSEKPEGELRAEKPEGELRAGKPDGELRARTGEGTPEVPGEPRDEEAGERKASNQDRWRLESGEQMREAPRSSRETPGGKWRKPPRPRRGVAYSGTIVPQV
ncbi:hypothetical protein NDU88_005218 [Pleurodeles waltl]|uniref:Uncharacterized protein n=1 Tax=Pleurodeles waltl TaxID=8319 RepID=A0AAV7LBW9_PLEWA|nr:hypothetical protein NDU88_005218 [Pleurodeles waltl]